MHDCLFPEAISLTLNPASDAFRLIQWTHFKTRKLIHHHFLQSMRSDLRKIFTYAALTGLWAGHCQRHNTKATERYMAGSRLMPIDTLSIRKRLEIISAPAVMRIISPDCSIRTSTFRLRLS